LIIEGGKRGRKREVHIGGEERKGSRPSILVDQVRRTQVPAPPGKRRVKKEGDSLIAASYQEGKSQPQQRIIRKIDRYQERSSSTKQ